MSHRERGDDAPCRAIGPSDNGEWAQRAPVAHLCREHEVSQRRACTVLGVDRSSVRYRSVRPDDADLRTAMKAVAGERRRFGYRRVHVMLERQGWQVNQKKLRRLYREETLQVSKRGGRKRVSGDAQADACAGAAKGALEPGFRFGCLHRRVPVQGAGHLGRLRP